LIIHTSCLYLGKTLLIKIVCVLMVTTYCIISITIALIESCFSHLCS